LLSVVIVSVSDDNILHFFSQLHSDLFCGFLVIWQIIGFDGDADADADADTDTGNNLIDCLFVTIVLMSRMIGIYFVNWLVVYYLYIYTNYFYYELGVVI
jgi:hypothetical protein